VIEGRGYLLWDGECRFCRHAVKLAFRIDRKATFAIRPHQDFTDAELATVGLTRERCYGALQCVLPSSEVKSGAFAINAFLRRFPSTAPFGFLAEALPLVLVAEIVAYTLIARNRHRLADLFGMR
jgi:predicted DCC family thiol-disulfide oxidoreductase YuxK